MKTTHNQKETEPLGGRPALGSKPSVPDLEAQVAYQRAFEAVLWAMPATSIHRMREGVFKAIGMGDDDIMAFSKPATPSGGFLAANNVTPYIAGFTDLRKGPVVLEIPAKTDKASLFGQVVDAWQVTIADVGGRGDRIPTCDIFVPNSRSGSPLLMGICCSSVDSRHSWGATATPRDVDKLFFVGGDIKVTRPFHHDLST
jgi:hypothetical protein